MRSRVYDGPSGDKGFMQIKDDKIFFNDNTPVRFFGMGLTIKNDIPPENREDIIKLVRTLSSYGFTHVRLIGLDFNASAICQQWMNHKNYERRFKY